MGWIGSQGVHLRVVGVCDSKSLVVAAPDAHASELDDKFLLEVCRVKGDGTSLSELSGFGNLIFLLFPTDGDGAEFNAHAYLILMSLSDVGVCRVFANSELTAKVFDIASHLGKSTGS